MINIDIIKKGQEIEIGGTRHICIIDRVENGNIITTLGREFPLTDCREYGVEGVEFIYSPIDSVEKQDITVELNKDYTAEKVFATIKNRKGEYLVVKTTDKTIHFIDHENGDKKRYVNLKSLKGIRKG